MHHLFSVKQAFSRTLFLCFRYFRYLTFSNKRYETDNGKQAQANTTRFNFSTFYTRIVLKIKLFLCVYTRIL